jgi:hypothetical protein
MGLFLWIRKWLSLSLLKQFRFRLKYGKGDSMRMGVENLWFILILFKSSVLYNFEIKGTYVYVCVQK